MGSLGRTDDALADAAHDAARHDNVLGHCRGRQSRSQVLRTLQNFPFCFSPSLEQTSQNNATRRALPSLLFRAAGPDCFDHDDDLARLVLSTGALSTVTRYWLRVSVCRFYRSLRWPHRSHGSPDFHLR